MHCDMKQTTSIKARLIDFALSIGRDMLQFHVMNTTTARMVLLIAAAVTAAIGDSPLRAQSSPLLFETHHGAGLTCAQCHDERPPDRAPAASKCTGCHGDQATLAGKTSAASPNPHAPPHMAPGETQVCTDCHHIHRRSEVTCTACHRDFFFDVK